MKRALANIVCEDKSFEIGKVYEDKEVVGLDSRDFEDVKPVSSFNDGKVEVFVTEKEPPKSMTTESIKPKRKTKK